MTAQTTTQRTAKHRLAVKERIARMTEALEAIAGYSEDNGMTRRRMRRIASDALNPTQHPTPPNEAVA